MKGFLSILALPAIILPALAAPTSSKTSLQEQDLAIMTSLYNEITPLETSFQSTVKNLTTKATPAQVTQLESEMNQVIAAVKSAKSQIKAANAAAGDLTTRSETPGAELLAELDKVVTEIGMGIATGIAAGQELPDELGNLEDQLLGELVQLGGPLAEAIPEATDAISAILEKLLGGSLPTSS